ncbi:hypothetical protein PMI07_001495 [Rhizobium sp. CF080]|uniref:DUF6894 family protein n=1 Tax=Rhizobium sp. (strain CF080) TaxID=1144310 RepID=UPI0002715EE7|nr:hypothetical protein [Rhizobium sp. CF080]EUB96596.1 hypothetical protein PMI07_001495 [Rhizobium sp. CF080]
MAKYFFDVINGEGPMRDDEGTDLPNADAVRAAVAKIAFDVAKDELEDQNGAVITVNVRDDSDFTVFSGHLLFSTEWRN